MLRAKQQTISFPAYDSSVTTGATKTGLALLAADVKLSKDGGAAVAATNPPVEIGTTGRYSLVLTAAETNCGYLHIWIEKAGMRPQDVYGFADEHPAAAVVADGANTATTFVTNLPSAVTDFYKGAGVAFTTGALAGSGPKEIASYNGTTKAITLAGPLPAIPAGGDLFSLITL
jgi:hypothetical protein